ncbi:uncharacterized protein LOC112493205 [Ziziphus jujuba]|uniref:Uncharacterized protein LOC112493205 n=1 Tax=Ziziphus jujuba TaxID=326968 RepID=A0ABM3I1N6_ZIZJJ|nr:uncharacterized protein LOC112493205 [Ziziphus jujuba]
MSTTAFGRGANSINSIFFKQIGRKAYHKKGSTGDGIRESMKVEGEEAKKMSQDNYYDYHNNNNNNFWIPHEKTGIYYPKGNEKVMQDVPPNAEKDMTPVNWFS